MEKHTKFINYSTKEKELNNSSDKNFFLDNSIREYKKLTPEIIIETLLRERNLTKADLSRMIGLQPQSLNHYLHGFWIIPTKIKIKIAEALGVDSAIIWDLEK